MYQRVLRKFRIAVVQQVCGTRDDRRITSRCWTVVAICGRDPVEPLADCEQSLEDRLPPVEGLVKAHRRTCNPKPGPALYVLRALAIALAENSAPAGRLVGSKIVHPSAIDVGFAVEAEDGVLVPVIRDADKKPLKDLTQRYNELVELARERKLPADATGGSVATVTNFGTFGLIWATPIPLPEQTLVLGLGAGQRMPHWDEAKGQFVPVMKAYLTLSFDHRVLDGGGAGRLLQRVGNLISQPEKL